MNSNRSLSVLTWLRLVRAVQKVGRGGETIIAEYGLSGAMFDVLAQIGGDEGVTQQELAEQLLVTKGNVSQLLSKLEQQGLVEKRAQGQAKHLYLTEKGRGLIEQIMPEHDAFVQERMSKLTNEELRQLNDLLRKLDKRLD
jgi:DNA-binding MarR family transcriptional regulator